MSSSFVNIGDHGFWMHDSFLELFLRLLALHVPEPEDRHSEARHAATTRIRDGWLLASKGFFSGAVPVCLEEAVSTEDGKVIVQKAIRSLLRALPNGPHTISTPLFHILGLSDATRRSGIEADCLIDAGHAFLDLIDGKIAWTAGDGQYIRSS